MHRFRALLLIPVLFFVLMPSIASAAGLPLLDPSWHVVPDAHELDESCPVGAPLGIGGVIVLVQNLMNAAVSLTVIVLTFMLAYSGFLLITSPFNSENRTVAKTSLFNACMGVLVVLSAWLIVDFAMKILYNPEATFGGKAIGPWNQVLVGGDACITKGETGPLFGRFELSKPSVNPDNSINRPSGGAGGSGSSSRGGRCTVQTSGPCSTGALAAFGSAAPQASQICNAESRGNITSVSGSDRMRNDPARRAFSFGLFQINLTQHKVGGLNCPAAFSGKNYSATVVNESLYVQCVAAAKDPNKNIAEAVTTYNRSRWREWSTGRTCGLAQVTGGNLAVSECSVGELSYTL